MLPAALGGTAGGGVRRVLTQRWGGRGGQLQVRAGCVKLEALGSCGPSVLLPWGRGCTWAGGLCGGPGERAAPHPTEHLRI